MLPSDSDMNVMECQFAVHEAGSHRDYILFGKYQDKSLTYHFLAAPHKAVMFNINQKQHNPTMWLYANQGGCM